MENITFTKIKDIAGYTIYYAIPEQQRKIHINLSRTTMFVMYADQIVFIPTKNMRSKFSMEIECENWINQQIEKDEAQDVARSGKQ